jgi:hypothetical protein
MSALLLPKRRSWLQGANVLADVDASLYDTCVLRIPPKREDAIMGSRWGIVAIVLLTASRSHGQVFISEVHPTGSSDGSAYAADFFELCYLGPAGSISVTGWRVSNGSFSFANSVPLTGITALSQNRPAVMMEGNAANNAVFINSWFGGPAPQGYVMGNYTGFDLNPSGDGVMVFDSTGAIMAGVQFGVATPGVTFDNAAGINGTSNPPPTISTLSQVGVHGGFQSAASPFEIGSPGTIGIPLPEPSSFLLLGLGIGVLSRRFPRWIGSIQP